MRWYYEEGGQTRGPVEDHEVRDLVQKGTLSYSSRLILEGASNWGTVGGQASQLGVDPNAGGQGQQLPAFVNNVRLSAEDRKAILAKQVQMATVSGRRVESQSDFQAVLVLGKPVNHVLHAILTVFTCLLWGIVWLIMGLTGGEKRELVVVDEYGNVQIQHMGKS